MLVMTASPEHEPEESAAPDAQQPPARTPAPDERPMSRFAERFRIPLGVLVAVVGLGLAVVFAVRPLDAGTGPRGLIVQGAGVALWLCVVGVGVSWAIGASRRVVNGFALAGVICYVAFWLAGL